MDLYSIITALPWVVAHPWFLVCIPAIFWLITQIWAYVPPPNETSSDFWRIAYSIINTVIAANRKYCTNAIVPNIQNANTIVTVTTTQEKSNV